MSAIDPLVLAVDDEVGILRLLKLELTAQGFRVVMANDGEEALRLVEQHRPDLVILDILLPDMTGLEVMRQMRERTPNLPIIILSGKDHDEDKVRGLTLGADDYVTKPFNPDELGARVRAILRRPRGNSSVEGTVEIEDVEIDLNRRLVRKGGKVISMTRTEWMLLQYLATNAGRVMLNAELLTKVWGPEYRDDLQYLRVWISRLRTKLDANPQEKTMIKNVPGIGYILDVEGHKALDN